MQLLLVCLDTAKYQGYHEGDEDRDQCFKVGAVTLQPRHKGVLDQAEDGNNCRMWGEREPCVLGCQGVGILK